MPDHIRQYFIIAIAWLSQQFQSSAFHCLHRHGYLAMAGEKGNRHVTAFGSEALREFETIQIRRRYIKDETPRTADRGRARNSCADANVQGMDQYLRPTHSFFSYGLIATIVPSEGNLATDSSSEGSSQLTRVPNEDPP